MALKPTPWTWTPYDANSETMPILKAADGSTIMDFGRFMEYYPEPGGPPDEEHMRAIAALPETLAELAVVRATLAAAMAELRSLEWVEDLRYITYCPSCRQVAREGHAPNCSLSAVLARSETTAKGDQP